MNWGHLLSELRRRKVFRVAAVYAVVAWLVVQVADTTFPHLGLPGWTITLVIALAVLGFPIALVLAWAFEVTPEGVRRTETASAPGSSSALPMRPVLYFLAGLLLALGGAWALAGDGEPTGGAPLDDDAVAVLPFRTAGAAGELSYLREGMVDLLATKLSGGGGLQAVDPSTVLNAWQEIAGERATIPLDSAILLARRVGAGRLLSGSVTSTPGKLILSARLLNTSNQSMEAEASVEGPADGYGTTLTRVAIRLGRWATRSRRSAGPLRITNEIYEYIATTADAAIAA